MHKIDSDGATVDNKFTEGNAALSIPATVVSAAIANAWQEELVNVIEGVGITLLTSTTDTFDQLNAAIIKLIQQGGQAAPLVQVLANDTTDADVTGFPSLNNATIKSIEAFYTVERSTDASNVVETGRVYATYNSVAGSWQVDQVSHHGDAGTVFTESGGVLKYNTDDLAGGTYVGELKMTDIKIITV